MKKKNILVTAFLLIATFAFLSSCKRTGVEEPTPFSPSSFTNLLKLSTNKNAIFAGNIQYGATRGIVNITATLYKYDGTPIPNRTIFFEIFDTSGQKLDSRFGYFEGGSSIASRTTDSKGTISLNYFGPYADYITADMTINVRATVSWPDTEIIWEQTPIIIIKDFSAGEGFVSFNIDPNVLYADEKKPEAWVTAQFTYGGIPVSGLKVYFLIIGNGPGYFDDQLRATFRETDSQGIAKIKYIGPSMYEINGDTSVYFRVQISESDYWEGGDAPLLPALALRLIRKR